MIEKDQIDRIAGRVEELELNDSLPGKLKTEFDGIFFSYCLDDDVNNCEPVAERERFNLFLVDTSDHCWTLTSDASIATGVVVAEVVNLFESFES